MPDEIGSEYQYIVNCLDALTQKRYREALKVLDDGLRGQLQSSTEIDGRLLLKHISAVVSYLEYRFEEDFGFSVEEVDAQTKARSKRRCAFCGTGETRNQLVAGPAVSICAKCIKECAALIT